MSDAAPDTTPPAPAGEQAQKQTPPPATPPPQQSSGGDANAAFTKEMKEMRAELQASKSALDAQLKEIKAHKEMMQQTRLKEQAPKIKRTVATLEKACAWKSGQIPKNFQEIIGTGFLTPGGNDPLAVGLTQLADNWEKMSGDLETATAGLAKLTEENAKLARQNTGMREKFREASEQVSQQRPSYATQSLADLFNPSALEDDMLEEGEGEEGEEEDDAMETDETNEKDQEPEPAPQQRAPPKTPVRSKKRKRAPSSASHPAVANALSSAATPWNLNGAAARVGITASRDEAEGPEGRFNYDRRQEWGGSTAQIRATLMGIKTCPPAKRQKTGNYAKKPVGVGSISAATRAQMTALMGE